MSSRPEGAIPPFDEKNIQTVRRWLKEAEAAVHVDYVHSGGAGDSFLVRDFDSFKDLVPIKREPGPRGSASRFDVYCGPHFALRGIVDESFIGRTEAEFPEPDNLWIIDPRSVYPERIGFHGLADSVEEVNSVLRGLVGEYVAVGPYPGDENADVWDANHPGRALRNRYWVRGQQNGYIRAWLQLFADDDRRRRRYIHVGYPGEFGIGEELPATDSHRAIISVEGQGLIGPGEEGVVRLHPLDPEPWSVVAPGMKLALQEGEHVLGLAEVLQVDLTQT